MFEVSLLYLPLILIQLLLIVVTAAFVAKLLILGVSNLATKAAVTTINKS